MFVAIQLVGQHGVDLGHAFAEVRCVREVIATFHSPEFFLCQVQASCEVALVFGIADQELAFFGFLDG